MSQRLARYVSVVVLVLGCGVLAKGDPGEGEAGGPPADSVSGKLKATGGAGSGAFSVEYSGFATAVATVQVDYYIWDGTAWQYTTISQVQGVNGNAAFSATLPYPNGVSGKSYYAHIRLLRGNPPVAVAQCTTNSLVAP